MSRINYEEKLKTTTEIENVKESSFPLPPPSKFEIEKMEEIPLFDVFVDENKSMTKSHDSDSSMPDGLKDMFIQMDEIKDRNMYLEKLLVEKDERALSAEEDKVRIMETFSIVMLLNFVMFGYFFVWKH